MKNEPQSDPEMDWLMSLPSDKPPPGSGFAITVIGLGGLSWIGAAICLFVKACIWAATDSHYAGEAWGRWSLVLFLTGMALAFVGIFIAVGVSLQEEEESDERASRHL